MIPRLDLQLKSLSLTKILAHYQEEAHKARFPALKTIEEFDFSFQPQLNEKEIIRLTSLDFVEKKENLLFLGPPGVGKTHLAIAFGVKACMAKYRVLFIHTQDLLANLLVAQKTGKKACSRLGRFWS